MRELFIASVLSMLLVSCHDQEFAVPEATIDAVLVPYFETFVAEGASRGVVVDFDSNPVSGHIRPIEGLEVAGQCFHNSDAPSGIVIDQRYWSTISGLRREFVVFHELGHCYLDRDHLDTANSDGTCISIMHSGETRCINAYSTVTRNAYLDELFGI